MGKIKSNIINKEGLLLQEYSGDLTKLDLATYFNNLYLNPEYQQVSKIYSDFINASVALSVDDIAEIAYFILEHAPKVQHVTNAILVCEPLITAYSILYEEIMREMPLYECKIFCTLDEAANFINYDVNKLKELINNY